MKEKNQSLIDAYEKLYVGAITDDKLDNDQKAQIQEQRRQMTRVMDNYFARLESVEKDMERDFEREKGRLESLVSSLKKPRPA